MSMLIPEEVVLQMRQNLGREFSIYTSMSQTIRVAMLVSFTVFSSMVQASDPPLCPGHVSLEWSQDVRAVCYENMPGSTSQCEELVQRLSSRETLTTQQRFDLAEAQQTLADWILEGQETLPRFEELRMNAARNFRLLHKEHPDDVMVLFYLFVFTDRTPFQRNGSDYPHLQRILNVAPDCSRVRMFLLKAMYYKPAYLSNDDPVWVSELTQHLEDGYRLARDKRSEMEFAAMRFNSELHKYGYEFAKSFRQKVFSELQIATLEFDGESRTENLNALCDYSAFQLQFTEYCIDAIQQALKIDVDLHRLPDAAVLEALRKMQSALTNPGTGRSVLHHPIQNREYTFLGFPFFPHEATKYAIRLNDILSELPTELHSIDLYRVASSFMGKHAEIDFLEGLLQRNPTDAYARAYLDALQSD